MQKPEAIIFVVGVVLLTLTSGKHTKPKKTNKQKTFNLLEIFQRLSPILNVTPRPILHIGRRKAL